MRLCLWRLHFMITLNHIRIRWRSILPRLARPRRLLRWLLRLLLLLLRRGRLALRLGHLRKAVDGAALLAGELAAGGLAAHGAVAVVRATRRRGALLHVVVCDGGILAVADWLVVVGVRVFQDDVPGV